jgi:hypothetical protein
MQQRSLGLFGQPLLSGVMCLANHGMQSWVRLSERRYFVTCCHRAPYTLNPSALLLQALTDMLCKNRRCFKHLISCSKQCDTHHLVNEQPGSLRRAINEVDACNRLPTISCPMGHGKTEKWTESLQYRTARRGHYYNLAPKA